MEDQYSMADLKHFLTRTSHFPPYPPPPPPPPPHFPLDPQQQLPYDHFDPHHPFLSRHVTHILPSDSGTAATATPPLPPPSFPSGFDPDGSGGGGGGGGGDSGAARWPRQETLTLLEIRSRLDYKFKESVHKGPLWDEVSRIMADEHGYQRSGKKCREKFENLYKYYKKTKEGKAGRHDGKHYRFFRQLDALYGHQNPTNTAATPPSQGPRVNETSVSISQSSDFATSSSDGEDALSATVKEFIDSQMRKMMEKQEEWMEKMMRTMENREEERMKREAEWRRQEAERAEREHKFWADERAWIEARDSALIAALHRLGATQASRRSHRSGGEAAETAAVATRLQLNDFPTASSGAGGSANDDVVIGNGVMNESCLQFFYGQ